MATAFAPSCPQSEFYYFSNPQVCQGYSRGKCEGYSEDCLSLNIWTPGTSGSRAVMVWIHGGCFVSGSASDPQYDGAALAGTQDVVVVSVQYRLGVFGWLADDSLRKRDPNGSTGNYGLMDNVAALRWVQENIFAFGGDPSRVTIFGESSGAGSISQLLTVSAAWPYFHRAIMESGTASAWTYMDMQAAASNFATVTAAAGCRGGGDVVDCLVWAGADSIVSAVSAVPCRDGCTWAPVIDGVYVTGRTMRLAHQGKIRPNTTVMAGFNRNDGAMFVPCYPTCMASMAGSNLHRYFARRFGSERVGMLQDIFPPDSTAYAPWLSPDFYAAQYCETDFSYGCTAQWFSSAVDAAGGSRAYVYKFTEPTTYDLVLHGDEIGYVFGTIDSPSGHQAKVALITMSYWAQFARSGDPNVFGLPPWPTWDTGGALMNLNAQAAVEYMPFDTYPGCRFFRDYWDYYGGCLPHNHLSNMSSMGAATTGDVPTRSVMV